jgi:hypothetical protein
MRVIARGDEPDSLAATAVLRRGYHSGGSLESWDYAIQCYERWGVRMARGGAVSSYRRLLAEPRADADWTLIDPAAPLVQADVKREVVSAHGGRVWFGPGAGEAGDAVVVACGARGGLLRPAGAVGGAIVTYGVTWVHAPEALKEPEVMRVYQYAPYRTLLAGVAGGKARVGSSSAAGEEKAVEQGRKMLQTAWDLGWLTTLDEWEMRVGARLKSQEVWWREGDGHWEIGGFHRTGYALAPGAARDVLDDIEKSAL